MTIFYTADTHFGHNSILKFCPRPWVNAFEMDAGLIDRWNFVVTNEDTVYVLGDFTFKGKTRADEYLARLNGTKHLIIGNHDPESTQSREGWASVSHYAEVKDGDAKCVLFHYPIREWNGCYHGTYHLYGHVHGGAPAEGRSLDVGVDCWDYTPVTLDQIKARMIELGTHDVFIPHHARVAGRTTLDPNWKDA